MSKLLHKLVFSALILAAGASQATVYTENFNQPFPTWESNWFGANSNARNYYCGGALNCTSRGNNPDGIWLWGSNGIDVAFNSGFGSSLTSFTMGVAGYAGTTLTAYDMDGNLIFSQNVALTSGAFTNPGVYNYYTINSGNGISHFNFSGSSPGNTSIDNLTAVTGERNVVPEPASIALFGLGLLGVAGMRRRSLSK